MAQSARVPGGVVSHLEGQVQVLPSGQQVPRPLAAGDVIQPGDVLLASQDAQLQVTDEQGRSWQPLEVQVAMGGLPEPGQRTGKGKTPIRLDTSDDVDATIQAINQGDAQDAPGAGLGGGGSGMTPGLRVDRVIETVTPQEFAYSLAERGPVAAFGAVAEVSPPAAPVSNRAPVINDPDNPNYSPATGRYRVTTDEDTPVSGQVKASDADGDPLSFALGTAPSNGSVTVRADGSWSYQPAENYEGPDSFTVVVSDGQGGTATATIDIGVMPVNDAPRIVEDDGNFDPVAGRYVANTDEDQAVSGQIKATDVDGDTLSYAPGVPPLHGSVIINSDGTWTFTPEPDFHGQDAFTVVIDDGVGGTTEATVLVNVQAVNDAPVVDDIDNENFDPIAGNYAFTTDEGQLVTGKIAATDADGDTLSYEVGAAPTNGEVELLDDGTWGYLPHAQFSGEDSFTVVVSDGNGGSVETTVHITVNPVNEAPEVKSVDNSEFIPELGAFILLAEEDTPLTSHIRATDADGDTLTYSVDTPTSYGKLDLNPDGSWTYTPDKDSNETDAFVVMVDDGHGGTTTVTVFIGVAPVNDGPEIDTKDDPTYDSKTASYNVTTDEDTSVGGQVKAIDVDDDPLSYLMGTAPMHGQASVDDKGQWTYTPQPNYNGPDAFSITISDGQGGTTTARVLVGVNPVNDAPLAEDASTSAEFDPIAGVFVLGTNEQTPLQGRVQASDADDDTLSYTAGTAPAHGSLTINDDGSWTYTPEADFSGQDTFTITVSDGQGGTDTVSYQVHVAAVNEPPVVDDIDNANFDPISGNYAVMTDEGQLVTGRIVATDPDGDALSYEVGTAAAHGVVELLEDGTWGYLPNGQFNGEDSFTVIVSDGNGGSVETTVHITVNPVNEAPEVKSIDNSEFIAELDAFVLLTDEDAPLSSRIRATDADGDTLTYTTDTEPSYGSLALNPDGSWTYTPDKDTNGYDAFVVKVDDGHGGSTFAQVFIGVVPVNDGPEIDTKGDPTFDTRTASYIVTTDEDTSVSGHIKATDVDDDPLSFILGTSPQHGTVDISADGRWTYTPDANFNGPDAFNITVSDGQGGTTTANVLVGVNAVNDPPVIDRVDHAEFVADVGAYYLSTDEDTPLSSRIHASDSDADKLSYSIDTAPQHGELVLKADGSWTYTPNTEFNGNDLFVALVNDGHGGITPVVVYIGVQPVNDGPRIDGGGDDNFDPFSGRYVVNTLEDQSVKGQVKASDADGDALNFTLGTAPQHGFLQLLDNGKWVYTPEPNYNGPDAFSITVSDGRGGTATATVLVGVTPLNDAPELHPEGLSNFDPSSGTYMVLADEDTPVSGRVKATDVDGDSLTFSPGQAPANGSVSLTPDGQWTYTPNANYNGVDSFTVLVDDGHGGQTTATVIVRIEPLNDAPQFVDPGDGSFDPNTGNYSVTTREDIPLLGKVRGLDMDEEFGLAFHKASSPAHGNVIVKPDGTWVYTPAKDFNGADSFSIFMYDSGGERVVTTVNIGVLPVNDAPTLNLQSTPANLSEEALAGGKADTTGSPDTGNLRETTGKLAFGDVDGDKLSLTLQGPSGLSSGGVSITWSGTGTAAQPLVGSAGGKPVLTATIDEQGQYKLTLQGPIDQPDASKEDAITVKLQVVASDGQASSTTELPLTIEDDAPASGSSTLSVTATVGTQNTNLMLVIDTSKSMSSTLADKTVNGIKAAINALIDRYDAIGDVKIQIVTFNDNGQGRAAWLNVDQAKAFVAALTASGGTNYDAALAAAKAAFSAPGKLVDGVNVSYFITDGQPNKGKGLDAADENNWEAFVKANHIDSYAIGTGSLTAQYVSNIEPVAYNGISQAEQGAVTLKTNQELTKYLLDTVPTLKSGTLAGLAGADGLSKIEAFSSDKQVNSTLDPASKILTVVLQSGAEIRVNTSTGEFSLKQGRTGGDETFSYTIVDKDGDRGTGTVTITTSGTTTQPSQPTTLNQAPDAYVADGDRSHILDLLGISHGAHSSGHILQVKDADNNLSRIDISVPSAAATGSIDSSKLSLTLDASLTKGLHIVGNDSRHIVIEAEVPGQRIDAAQVNKLLATLGYTPSQQSGSDCDDKLPLVTLKATDTAGASDTQTASSSIVLADAHATDLSNIGEHHHEGHGSHHAGFGVDVFKWTLADHAPTSDHRVDTIHDFDCSARSAGGDVLDLRDLLQVDSGANAGTGTVDKLLTHLEFDTQSQPGSTVIHVSGSGGFQPDAHGSCDTAKAADQQHIVLSEVNIRSALGLDAQASDHQIITELMQRGKLLVDNC
jgi:large repetitive protein